MKPTKKNAYELKNLRAPLILLLSFWSIAIILWQASGNIFYLFNFGYIGTAVGLGIGLYVILPNKKKPSGRRFAQLLIGIYMLGFLGIVKMENMQLEGFFFYLISGFFAGSVIHYLVAKILGRFYLEEASAVGHAGLPWSSISFLIKETTEVELRQNGRH